MGSMPGESNVEVLIAEDDRAVRESLARAMVLEGYRVTAVSNGAEALDAVRVAQPDVILLDVSMPLVDGLTVSRVLRSEQNHVPVLMLTARTETSDRVAGLDAGADDYLPKPYDLDELLARVRALLRRATYDDEAAAPTELVVGGRRLAVRRGLRRWQSLLGRYLRGYVLRLGHAETGRRSDLGRLFVVGIRQPARRSARRDRPFS